MYKKLLVVGIIMIVSHSISAMTNMQVQIPSYYERIIMREYNRRNGPNTYTSINAITSQTLEGKSFAQKMQIINDLHALQYATDLALLDASNNGTRLWYWLYLVKDNEVVINLLSQTLQKIQQKIRLYTWEMRSDTTKATWYIATNLGVATLGIVALYASRGFLPQDKPINEIGLHHMLAAPLLAGFALITGKNSL